MSVCTEADVRLQRPVLVVVERLVSGGGEVRNLVALDTKHPQPIDSVEVELGDLVFRRHLGRAVAGTALPKF